MSQQRLNGLSMISIENEILEGPNYISPKRLAFQHKFPYLSSFPSLSIRTGRMDPRRMDPRALVADAEYLEEIERARRDLRALIFGKRCAPIMLRLAWNDAATYIAKIKLGGPNGSIRFEDEYTHAANNGLKIAIDLCEEVKSKHPRITYADLYQLAGVVAVEVTGGPNINFVAGRKELHMSPPEGFLPDAKKGSSHLRAVFNRMGFSDKDIVALSGAHTLGRAHSDRSGFDDKAWTKDPLKFDNSYFVELLKGETYKLLKLPTDKALVEDLDFRCYVELYAKDQEAFFKDYAESHKKFSEFGYYQPSYSNPKPNTTVTSVLAQYVPKSITASASFMAQFVLGIAVVATVAILSFFWKSAGNSEAHDGLHSSLKNNYYGCPPTICQVQPSYSKAMDGNYANVVDNETSNKKTKKHIVWDSATFNLFIDACLIELEKGNRPGTHFNKTGWANLEKTMNEKTNKNFDKKQLKNKWDNMKKDWKLYDRLIRLETRIGGTRNLIEASSEWWEEKIKVDKEFAKFRDTNLDIYETRYAPLFRDSVVVGDQTMTPLQFKNNNSNSNKFRHEEESGGMNLGDDEDLFPSIVECSSSKRKKSKDVTNDCSAKCKASAFEEKLDVVLDALTTKSTQTFPPNNFSPTISDCMNIVISFPGFNEGSKKYAKALLVFVKKQNREAFMFPTTHKAKMEFLNLLIEE